MKAAEQRSFIYSTNLFFNNFGGGCALRLDCGTGYLAVPCGLQSTQAQ